MAEGLSAKEAALELGTDARTFRKFMRSITETDARPGQGNRWSIQRGQLKSLKKKFADWQAGKVKAASTNGTKAKVSAEVEDISDADVASIDDLDLDLSEIQDPDEGDLEEDDTEDEEDAEDDDEVEVDDE